MSIITLTSVFHASLCAKINVSLNLLISNQRKTEKQLAYGQFRARRVRCIHLTTSSLIMALRTYVTRTGNPSRMGPPCELVLLKPPVIT